MQRHKIAAQRRRRLPMPFLLLVALLPVITACAGLGRPPAADDATLRIETGYVRPAQAGQNSAAYFTLVNPAGTEDRLAAVRGDVAAAIELHETTNEGGVMKMTPHSDGFAIPARSSLDARPGGKHIMLMTLNQELVVGQTITLTFVLQKAGEVQVSLPVRQSE